TVLDRRSVEGDSGRTARALAHVGRTYAGRSLLHSHRVFHAWARVARRVGWRDHWAWGERRVGRAAFAARAVRLRVRRALRAAAACCLPDARLTRRGTPTAMHAARSKGAQHTATQCAAMGLILVATLTLGLPAQQQQSTEARLRTQRDEL